MIPKQGKKELVLQYQEQVSVTGHLKHFWVWISSEVIHFRRKVITLYSSQCIEYLGSCIGLNWLFTNMLVVAKLSRPGQIFAKILIINV